MSFSASSAASVHEENTSLLSGTSFPKWSLGNESQNAAVQDATCSDSAITLIQGPPGSGKTITCAEIVRRWLLSSGDPVILVAETNEGVDNLLKKLLEHGVPQEKIVRFGSSGWKVAKDLEHLTFESKYRQRVSDKRDRNRIDKKMAKRILESCKILCTTCISAGSALLEGFVFKRVLIDEASQATEPAILVSLSHGCQKLVLVGKLSKHSTNLTVPESDAIKPAVYLYINMTVPRTHDNFRSARFYSSASGI